MKRRRDRILETVTVIFVMAITSVTTFAQVSTNIVQPVYDYQVVDLGTLSGGNYSQAFGINASGQVVGLAYKSDGLPHPFLYSDGVMQDITALNTYGVALAINDSGQIVGYSDINGINLSHAFLYSGGVMQDLGTLGGLNSYAQGINNGGQVVGFSQTTGSSLQHAFLYSGSMQDLGTFGGSESFALGINNSGDIVGYFNTNNVIHSFFYSDGSMRDIGVFYIDSYAMCINRNGQIAGFASYNFSEHPFLYDGSFKDLGTLGGLNSYAQGFGINSSGEVVGYSQMSTGAYNHAFIYLNGGMRDLNTMFINGGSGWILQQANGINDAGQIVGWGINPSGQTHAFLLNPLPTGWRRAITNQPSAKTYGIPPARSADGLVLITHGWTPRLLNLLSPSDPTWVDTMSNSIAGYLNSHSVTGWQVYGYKWIQNSWTFHSMDALNNATQEGINLGNSIVNQGWTKVHFISHSAGAQLIQTATQVIKSQAPNTIVQCTFLDPFVGFNGAGATTYGNEANWSDRYSASHDIFVGGGIFTDVPLYSSYNVEVTALDSSIVNSGLFTGLSGYAICSVFQSSHSWPIDFYKNTITGNVTSDYDGFGFPLSIEAGGWPNAPTQYPVGNVNSVTNLGNLPQSCSLLGALEETVGIHVNFTTTPKAAQSTSGTVIMSGDTLTLITGSPAWLSIVPTNTDPVNLLSFDANFTNSSAGAAGLLSVLWDSGTICTVDERAVGQGVAHYALHFNTTESNSTHVLSFRLDPFTNVQSTVVITNVVLGQQGVVQPFSLSATTNKVNGAIVYQLTGQAGFDYGLQASTNLIDWTQIAVLENTNGVVSFSDQSSTNSPMRFYRAVAPY